jgi:hypothetical protein
MSETTWILSSRKYTRLLSQTTWIIQPCKHSVPQFTPFPRAGNGRWAPYARFEGDKNLWVVHAGESIYCAICYVQPVLKGGRRSWLDTYGRSHGNPHNPLVLLISTPILKRPELTVDGAPCSFAFIVGAAHATWLIRNGGNSLAVGGASGERSGGRLTLHSY